MSAEAFENTADNDASENIVWEILNQPLNGTDARRRIEDKIEELKLQRELQEFNFDC